MADGKPGLMVFQDCARLIRDIPALQHSEKNPSDCATEPHEIPHSPDACRYFCAFRAMGATKEEVRHGYEEDDDLEDYDYAMCGGEADRSYLAYG